MKIQPYSLLFINRIIRSTCISSIARILTATSLSLCFIFSNIAHASEVNILDAVNLKEEALAVAKEKSALVLFFTLPKCPHCHKILKNNILPLMRDGKTSNGQKVFFRNITLGSDKELIDFNGEKSTHGEFSEFEGMKFVPIVAFYGVDGNQLADPLLGTLIEDFYQSYLEDGIEKASAKIK